MKKLNVILDETTIINFSFFRKLIRRYYLICSIIPLLVIGFSYSFYNSQNIIFMQSKSFKNVSNDADSPTIAIAKIIGESQEGVDASEIIGMTQSLDFIKKLATDIYESGKYLSFNYNSLNSKNKINSNTYFSKCNDNRECIVKHIMGAVAGLYTVDQDPSVMKRFVVHVNTLDSWSTQFLLERVEIVLQKMRLDSISHLISQQKELMSELVKKEHLKLNQDGSYNLEERNVKLKDEINFIGSRIKLVQGNLHNKRVELDLAEANLEQTKKTLSRKFTQSEVELSKRAKALNVKIEKLRQDINAVEVSLVDLSIEDKSIINQLKSDLKTAQDELYAIPNYKKYIDTTEDFLDKKDQSSKNVAFDVKVKRTQFERAQSELDSLQKKLEGLVSEQTALESQMTTLKPQLEYMKLLENRLVQLTLLESTIVSDFVFSENVEEVSLYKRTSKGKVILFAIFVTFFLVFLIVIIRYLVDTKIYDEYELKKNFENIEVIGNTPDFN